MLRLYRVTVFILLCAIYMCVSQIHDVLRNAECKGDPEYSALFSEEILGENVGTP